MIIDGIAFKLMALSFIDFCGNFTYLDSVLLRLLNYALALHLPLMHISTSE
jgi:hypothetical protein